MNNLHRKSVTWLCVNPNKISTTRRQIQNEQCEQQAQIKFNYNFESLMLRNFIIDLTIELKLLTYKKKRLKWLRRKLTLNHKLLNKMK